MRSATVDEAVRAIHRSVGDTRPRTAVILGSGLGRLADEIDPRRCIPFADIPHFARTTAAGHRGQFVSGHLDGVPTVAMAGRFHLYEGWSVDRGDIA